MAKRDVNAQINKEDIRLQLLASTLVATDVPLSKTSRSPWAIPWQQLVKMVKTLQ